MPKLHAVSFAALFCAGTAFAQTAPATITLDQAHALVAKEIELVSKDYVFEDKRAAIVAAIRANEAAGQYDITNPAALAQKLGEDVIAISHDKHMWVQYAPQEYAATLEQQKLGDKPDAKQAAYFDMLAARSNHGYETLRILPGNVRYLNLVTFLWEGKTPQAVTDAARFLGGGDAVIIDLRENGGGTPDAVRAMVSYFMPPDHRLLMSYHDGMTGKVGTSHVTDKLAAPRMVGKPLYVLISGNTGSAAEEFAYHIKNFKLGTLVGQTTAGAANNDTGFPVAPGFVVSISTGRTVHPATGTNWEGVGVPPDVDVPADKALDQAMLLALQKLAAAPGPFAQDYAWAIEGEKAKLAPAIKLDAAAMADYAGTYGARTVRVEDGKLVFQRQGRGPLTMTPMSADLFSLGDADRYRLQFHRKDGKVTGFDMTTSDGQTVAAERS